MRPSTMASGAFEREATLVLQRLKKTRSCLIAEDDAQPERRWVLDGRRGQGRGAAAFPDPLIQAMLARGLLLGDPSGALRASAAGEARVEARTASTGDQHRLILRSGQTEGASLNRAESPLGWLRSRKDKSGEPLITEAQFAAGERLREDFTLAQLSPCVTSAWHFTQTPGARRPSAPRPESLLVSERALAAKARFHRALEAVGPELAAIVVEVCCLARGLEAAERRLGWPQRSGKLVLGMALSMLARHYGLIRPERPAGSTPIRHWAAPGYRPSIDGA